MLFGSVGGHRYCRYCGVSSASMAQASSPAGPLRHLKPPPVPPVGPRRFARAHRPLSPGGGDAFRRFGACARAGEMRGNPAECQRSGRDLHRSRKCRAVASRDVHSAAVIGRICSRRSRAVSWSGRRCAAGRSACLGARCQAVSSRRHVRPAGGGNDARHGTGPPRRHAFGSAQTASMRSRQPSRQTPGLSLTASVDRRSERVGRRWRLPVKHGTGSFSGRVERPVNTSSWGVYRAQQVTLSR